MELEVVKEEEEQQQEVEGKSNEADNGIKENGKYKMVEGANDEADGKIIGEIEERGHFSNNEWLKKREGSIGALCAFLCASCLAVSYICIQVMLIVSYPLINMNSPQQTACLPKGYGKQGSNGPRNICNSDIHQSLFNCN